MKGLLNQGVKTAIGWFVEDQQLRRMHHRHDQAEFALIARRQITHALACIQLQALGNLIGMLGISLGIAAHAGNVVDDLIARTPLPQAKFAREKADPPMDVDAAFPDVHTEDRRRAISRPDQIEQHANRGRFAGAIGTKIAEDLTTIDVQAEIVKRYRGVANRNRRFSIAPAFRSRFRSPYLAPYSLPKLAVNPLKTASQPVQIIVLCQILLSMKIDPTPKL